MAGFKPQIILKLPLAADNLSVEITEVFGDVRQLAVEIPADGDPASPGAISLRAVSRPRPARQKDLTWNIQFRAGAHPAEGTMRWLAQRAEISIPAESLKIPGTLKFSLSNGDLWCYGGQRIQTTVTLGGRTMAQLCFGRDGETHNVLLPVEPADGPLPLVIESSAAFVPARIDAKSQDQRSLAVKLQDISLVETPAADVQIETLSL